MCGLFMPKRITSGSSGLMRYRSKIKIGGTASHQLTAAGSEGRSGAMVFSPRYDSYH